MNKLSAIVLIAAALGVAGANAQTAAPPRGRSKLSSPDSSK